MKSKKPVVITIIIIIAAVAAVLIFTNVFWLAKKTEVVKQDDMAEDGITSQETHDRIGERLIPNTVITLEVGDICYFIGDELASIPYRWVYDISDESVMGVYSDESWSDSDANTAPGGGEGWRLIHFEALAPGECTIMIENKYMFEEDESLSENANIYKIEVSIQGDIAEDTEEDEDTDELSQRFYGVELDTEIVNTLEVGDICHFFGGETASIPYRWFYEISDERVMGLYKDEVWSDSDPDAAPGGSKGWRMIIFEALAPGECTIMIENKYMYDDEPFSEDADIFKILVTE